MGDQVFAPRACYEPSKKRKHRTGPGCSGCSFFLPLFFWAQKRGKVVSEKETTASQLDCSLLGPLGPLIRSGRSRVSSRQWVDPTTVVRMVAEVIVGPADEPAVPHADLGQVPSECCFWACGEGVEPRLKVSADATEVQRLWVH